MVSNSYSPVPQVRGWTRGAEEDGDAVEQILIGRSAAMLRLRQTIRRVAPTNLPLLIHGPTGSGKELVARAVHAVSERRGRLVAFNVCAIAEALFEAALFGHVRGAFTGAVSESSGFLMEAHEGTAFLDEVGGLPLHAQAKLLRAVETGEFRPVGGRSDRRSTFRVIAATNNDLHHAAAAGTFRWDLLHRLEGAVIHVPALDERPEDIAPLAQYFAASALGLPQGGEAIGEDALDLLLARQWPGNVRELRHSVERAAALCGGGVIRRQDVVEAEALRGGGDRTLSFRTNREARRLIEALERAEGDVERAAAALGVHRATVYRRMRRLGLT